MKKFIANATKNPGNKGVTNKVIEFLKYEGDAVLETNELSMNQIKRIATKELGTEFSNKFKKKIVLL